MSGAGRLLALIPPLWAAVFATLVLALAPAPGLTSQTGGGNESGPGPVFGLSFRGHHRAYPIEYFSTATAINDLIRHQEIVVYHDPAQGIATAFIRMVLGEPIVFADAVKGALVDDLNTVTRWDLTTGKAVGGNLLGMELVPLPVALTSWSQWVASHPGTTVFTPDAP